MSFMQKMNETLNEDFNVSITENGAIGYRTTGKELLDLNFMTSSLRSESEAFIENCFAKAFFENRKLAVKWLFFASDVRGGMGERRLFRICFKYLANNFPEYALATMHLVAEYSRWDNIFNLIDTELKVPMCEFLNMQLANDIVSTRNNSGVSLLAKWLPSADATSKKTRVLAAQLRKEMHLNKKEYSAILHELRSYLDIVEKKMCNNRWDRIIYENVPSKANLLYKDAFLKHDEVRRREYLDKLAKGESKINSSTAFPHEILHKYECKPSGVDTTLEEMWKALPDYVNGQGNTICVCDGSGSMSCRAGYDSTVSRRTVASALSIYFAERSTGEFKDKFITFSRNPKLVDISRGKTLNEKYKIVRSHQEIANTNIEKVFDLILQTAIKYSMKQDEIPRNILILSDMEFDICARNNRNDRLDVKLFSVIASKYAENGYKLPRLVFWNIHSRTGTIPVKENKLGVALVSGFSPAIMKMVLSNKTDPFECLLEQLNSERYQAVEDALKNIE